MTASHCRRLTLAAALAATCVLVSSCGRMGDLDKPSTPVADQNKVDAPQKTKAPEHKFLLDPLL